MKKPLLTLIFALATFSALSQITRIDTVKADNFVLQKPYRKVEIQNSYTFTLGTNLFGLEQFPKILNQTNGNDLNASFLNGLIFKYNDNQISYRFSGSLNNETATFKNECEDCEAATGKIQDYQIRAGFEKSILYTRVQPYFGAEIGYRSNRFRGSAKASGGTYSVTPYDVLAEKKGATLTPLAGIRFNLMNHITLSSEAGFDIFYSYERQEKTFQDNNRTRTLQTYRRLEFLPRPLASLSLQYNFGMTD